MTPEEKLLALIQQDKRQAEGAAPKPAAPALPVASPAAVSQPSSGPSASAPAPVVQPAVPPVSPAKKTESPVKADVQAEKKLKLAEPVVVKPSVEPIPANPAPSVAAAPVVAQDLAPTPAPAAGPQDKAVQPFLVLDGQSSSRGSRLVFLNRVLGGIVLILVILVFYWVGSIQPGIAKSIDRQVSGAGTMSVPRLYVTEQAVPPLDTYLDKVGSRNIFQAKASVKEGVAVAVEVTGAPKDLKLVAISMDSTSEEDSVAIIKNKADSKTYFVKLGQSVGSTDYVLAKIHADRVIVKLRKQEYELK